MLDWMGESNSAALIGLFGGVLLGLAARIGRFCTLGAIEDLLYGQDDRRLRMWGIAIAVAVIATHLAMGQDLLEAQDTRYLAQRWSPVGTIIGGAMFGYGMALSGTCGHGALARLGGGDLRAFVMVLVMGLSAYVVMSGPLAHLRVWLFPTEPSLGAPQGVSLALAPLGIAPLTTGLAVGAVILAASLWRPQHRLSWAQMVWGAAVGVAIFTGWIGTSWIARTGFAPNPVETHSFAAPIGDTILYAMTASGGALSFGVGSVVGVVIGAAFGSISQGHFRWEACEDPRELKRQIFGAALMGPGAVLALGCSVGQGISAFSVLAYSAPVAFVAIFGGAALGLRHLIEGLTQYE